MSTVFDPLRLSSVAVDVLASGSATSDRLRDRQMTRFAQLLEVASRDSVLYRERLQGRDVATLPLRDVPVIAKSELMARFDDWVTSPQLKLAQLRAFMADPLRIGESYLGRYLVWESSGSSNEPGVFVQDAQAMAVYDALEALRRSAPRPWHRCFDPLMVAERIAFVGAMGGHFSSIVSVLRLRQLNPFLARSLKTFSILQPTSTLLDELNAFAPTVIATYPTVAALLADEACRGALSFAPREVWTGGETLGPAVRRRIESALGCTVRNSYGASEFMSIGWECSYGNMHANTDWLILEPIDEKGRPVPPGLPSYSTLLTNLANYVQPVIRYDLGDQIAIHHERCECGSPLPVIEVQGRRDDVLVMAGKKGRPVTILPLALTTVLEDEAGVFDFQVCQRDEHTLVLRLALCDAQAEPTIARCRKTLENFATHQGLAPLSMMVETGQTIARGRSGKLQRVLACASPGAFESIVR